MQPRRVGHRPSQIVTTYTARHDIALRVGQSPVYTIQSHTESRLTTVIAPVSYGFTDEFSSQIVTCEALFLIRRSAVRKNG